MTAITEYLKEIRKNLERGDATEHTYRPALEKLLEACGKGIEATNEPRRIACGAPDFNITRNSVPLGHVETKGIGVNLDEMERGKGANGEQFKRYSTLSNWILTDYLEFRWYVAGEKRLTVRVADLDSKGKLKPAASGEESLGELLTAFYAQPALTVGTAKELASRMAGLTRMIRDLILAALRQEDERAEQVKSGVIGETMPGYGASSNWLHEWLHAFRDTLIPDLDERQFADMFAQTLAYGLFAARVHAPDKLFSRESAATNLPRTNPFLRELFEQIAGVKMPDTIAWAVDDMVELLKHADMGEILQDFGKCKGREDPVVHFYETFLAAYDPAMREVRGVFYTPEPIVSYIVNSIDWLLKTRLGRPKGLADENTLILDTAVGTATFLYFVIDLIHQGFYAQLGAWDGYVGRHLLPRIFGFELLMAPYAVAHLKLSMLLEQSGYTFGSDQRLGIYLTNTLEEAAKKSEMLLGQFISREANAAAEIKRDRPIMVVLGNPPYSGHSANRSDTDVSVRKGDEYFGGYEIINNVLMPLKKKAGKDGSVRVPNFIGRLLREYYIVDGAWLDEKNSKWLQDDYVKFIRFAEWRINRTGEGVLGYVTNHGYLDNPTFRGMRQHLMRTFDEIYVLDLHGNSKKKETMPDGGKDENVFDIQQGVAILLAVKVKPEGGGTVKAPGRVFHADLWGRREIYEGERLIGGKYNWLWLNSAESTPWKELTPTTPSYFFVPYDTEFLSDYEEGWKVTDLFQSHTIGIITKRDHLTIHWTPEDVWKTVREFSSLSPEEARSKFGLPGDVRDWKVKWAQRDIVESGPVREKIVPVYYRPFDIRYTYYTGKSRGFLGWPFEKTMRHLMRGENQALITSRLTKGEPFKHAQVTRRIPEVICMSSKTSNNGFVFPLYLYPDPGSESGLCQGRYPNLSPVFLKALGKKLGLPQEGPHGLPQGLTPEDIFHYVYAVLHSQTYRTRYGEFLKGDFPRIPLTSSRDLFTRLAELGGELGALHLMESPKVEAFITEFPEKGTNIVDKVQYAAKDNRVWINRTQYFGGMPEEVWQFNVGGYQVCEKWLKNRRNRMLTYEDVQRYQKIVVALNETIRLMPAIEEVIEGHGGWPAAFESKSGVDQSGHSTPEAAEPGAEYDPTRGKRKL